MTREMTTLVPEGRFQVLSIDGGGIKGVFAAAVLAALEEDLGSIVVDSFDLIAGTSTGGIIALGLGLGMRPREIVDFYIKYGPRIFPPSYRMRNVQHWLGRKYSATALEDALRKCFGTKRFGDSGKRLVVPAYNLGEDDVYVFRTAHHERLRRDYKVEAWKVARATGAAPTYFTACRDVASLRLVDGGVWANNPMMVAVAEAVETLHVPLGQIHVCSLGTSEAVTRRPTRLDWGGKLPWVVGNQLIDLVLRGQSLAATNEATLLLGRDHVLRVNPAVASDMYELDGVTRASDLIGKAAHVSRQYAPEYAERFAAHVAPKFIPEYT